MVGTLTSTCFLNFWKIYFPHPIETGGDRRQGWGALPLVKLNEIKAKEAAGREQAKEDLDPPEETAHILRGGSAPTTARRLYSIHTRHISILMPVGICMTREKEMHSSLPEKQEKRQRKESDISDKRDINVVMTCGERVGRVRREALIHREGL